MGNHYRIWASLFAWLAGAVAMTGTVSAQTAKPSPKASASASVTITVTNRHSVALVELDATPTGLFIPKKLVANLAAGKTASAKVATDKDCVYDLHGIYADGTDTDSPSVDLCKGKTVNLLP
jgi:hypothetical protein